MQTLKTLRDTALAHGADGFPDLALLSRELGRVIHQHPRGLSTQLAPRRMRRRGFERWLLAERAKPAVRVLLLAWPPNYRTPMHNHIAHWSLQTVLHGAIEITSYADNGQADALSFRQRDWLGPGDGRWFEYDDGNTHRCRNLSQYDTAITLHVFGGALTSYDTGMLAEEKNVRLGHLPWGNLAGQVS